MSDQPNTNINASVVKQRTSKVPVLLALLSLVCTGYLAYEGIYGIFGVKNRIVKDEQQQQQLSMLAQQNQQLQHEISTLQQNQVRLHDEIRNITPNQTQIIIIQLNSLINAASQSLILYHDNSATVKLLGYALQLLNTNGAAQFNELKISLSKDLDTIQALTTFDNTIVGAKLDNLYQLTSQLNLTVAAAKTANFTQQQTSNPGIWQRFITNFKQTFLGVIKVEKANSDASNLMPQSDILLRQHLQLDILNARQAFLSRNQALWLQSINDAITISNKYFINDQFRIQELQILEELRQTNLSTASANLDLTMHSLLKLQQLAPIVTGSSESVVR